MSDPLASLREIMEALGATMDSILPGEVVPIGAEINVGEIGYTLDGKTFVWRGRAIVIYIKDHRNLSNSPQYYRSGHVSPERWLEAHPEEAKKYHLGLCQTIRRMIKNKAIGRYINGGNSVRRRNDAGYPIFPIEFGRGDHEIALQVCQHCLKDADIVGAFVKPVSEIRDFDIERWLEEKSASLCPNEPQFPIIPEHTATSVPPNEYPEDWSDTRKDMLRKHGFRCSDCGDSYNCRHKALLHVHHKNMQKGDNRRLNLEVICIKCHRKWHPGHKPLHACNRLLDEHEAKCNRPQPAD